MRLRSAGRRLVPAATRCPSQVGGDTFRFLNVEKNLGSRHGWNQASDLKLWLYNLHYFDDLTAQNAHERTGWHREIISRWVAENPPAEGVGWDPYPTSLRIVNWIQWSLLGNELEEAWLQSLALQARHLRRRIEWHLLGNHLFANGKALVFAGLFFAGPEANDWLRRGLKILEREVSEQVLADGGHFERSPMYHSIICEDLLDLVNVAGVYPGAIADSTVSEWRERASRMLVWLRTMCHPDGEISLFNDAAFAIAPSPDQIHGYAERLGVAPAATGAGEGLTQLPDSGYIRWQSRHATAFLDVAAVGPDYLPGHAHADTLSFELSLFGQRVIVNGGTSTYEKDAERQRQRGTAAHNTVEVDGEDSSEVWGGFRVARRAYPHDLEVLEEAGRTVVSCSHDGYRRLRGRVTHRRSWTFAQRDVLIEDSLDGRFEEAKAFLHFHPDVAIKVDSGGRRGELQLPGGQSARWEVESGKSAVEPTTYHPEFGLAQQTQKLIVSPEGRRIAVRLTF